MAKAPKKRAPREPSADSLDEELLEAGFGEGSEGLPDDNGPCDSAPVDRETRPSAKKGPKGSIPQEHPPAKASLGDLVPPARPSQSLRTTMRALAVAEAEMRKMQRVMCKRLQAILRVAEGERFGSPEEKRSFARRVNSIAKSKGLQLTYGSTPVYLMVQTSGSFELRSTKGNTPIKTSVALPRVSVTSRIATAEAP